MPDRESSLTTRQSYLIKRVAIGALLVGALAAGMWLLTSVDVTPGIVAVASAFIGALGTGTAAVMGASAARRQAKDFQDESRARLREAEQALEQALRGSAVGGDLRIGAVITADGDVSSSLGSEETPTPADRRGASNQTQALLSLPELWTVTHRRLDHYHGIALDQAKQSFRNAQIAMGLGFVMLAAFVTVALNASTMAGSIVAGGLGAVSAALAGYVSRTFVRSQEASAAHLRAYFDQPLEFSRYLAAERLMADARLGEEKRAEILSVLLQNMIAGPLVPGPTETGVQSTNAA